MARSHVIKFSRAQKHLRELEVRVGEWKSSVGESVFGETDPEDPGFQIFYFQNDPVPSDKLSSIVGDVLHNLRGSLDHLCFELAVAFTGRLSAKQEKYARFPIHRSEGEFRKGTAHLVGLIGSDACAIMERLQPYYVRPEKGPEWDLLWQLSELAAAEQHEVLSVVNVVVGRWSIESILPEDFDSTGCWFRTGVPPKGRAPIARLPLLPEGTEDAVMRKVAASLDVALANPPSPPAGDPVYEVLEDMSGCIQSRIFKVLEPLLPPSKRGE